jgi:hypothetical protein
MAPSVDDSGAGSADRLSHVGGINRATPPVAAPSHGGVLLCTQHNQVRSLPKVSWCTGRVILMLNCPAPKLIRGCFFTIAQNRCVDSTGASALRESAKEANLLKLKALTGTPVQLLPCFLYNQTTPHHFPVDVRKMMIASMSTKKYGGSIHFFFFKDQD